MGRKDPRMEQVINKLREAEVELAKGQTVRAVCRKLGVSVFPARQGCHGASTFQRAAEHDETARPLG